MLLKAIARIAFRRYADTEIIDMIALIDRVVAADDCLEQSETHRSLIRDLRNLIDSECDARHIDIKYLPTGGYITTWHDAAGNLL